MSDFRLHVAYKLASGRFLLLLAAILVYVAGSAVEIARMGAVPDWSATIMNLVFGWYLRAGYEATRKDGAT